MFKLLNFTHFKCNILAFITTCVYLSTEWLQNRMNMYLSDRQREKQTDRSLKLSEMIRVRSVVHLISAPSNLCTAGDPGRPGQIAWLHQRVSLFVYISFSKNYFILGSFLVELKFWKLPQLKFLIFEKYMHSDESQNIKNVTNVYFLVIPLFCRRGSKWQFSPEIWCQFTGV